jgi:hypothetical protein
MQLKLGFVFRRHTPVDVRFVVLTAVTVKNAALLDVKTELVLQPVNAM